MGEGRAGALRGDAMDDLIFAGTRTRPGRDAAEVTLTLEGRFPPPFADETRLRVAYSGDCDRLVRPMVITHSGDRDHLRRVALYGAAGRRAAVGRYD